MLRILLCCDGQLIVTCPVEVSIKMDAPDISNLQTGRHVSPISKFNIIINGQDKLIIISWRLLSQILQGKDAACNDEYISSA
jgi:hypothetical protein